MLFSCPCCTGGAHLASQNQLFGEPCRTWSAGQGRAGPGQGQGRARAGQGRPEQGQGRAGQGQGRPGQGGQGQGRARAGPQGRARAGPGQGQGRARAGPGQGQGRGQEGRRVKGQFFPASGAGQGSHQTPRAGQGRAGQRQPPLGGTPPDPQHRPKTRQR